MLRCSRLQQPIHLAGQDSENHCDRVVIHRSVLLPGRDLDRRCDLHRHLPRLRIELMSCFSKTSFVQSIDPASKQFIQFLQMSTKVPRLSIGLLRTTTPYCGFCWELKGGK